MSLKPCAKCHERPRRAFHAYCAECHAEYMRDYRSRGTWNASETDIGRAAVRYIRALVAAGLLVAGPCLTCGYPRRTMPVVTDPLNLSCVSWVCRKCNRKKLMVAY